MSFYKFPVIMRTAFFKGGWKTSNFAGSELVCGFNHEHVIICDHFLRLGITWIFKYMY